MGEDDGEDGAELRAVTRVSGGAPGRVRMRDLRRGDVFTLGERPGELRACGEPYLQGRGEPPGVHTPGRPGVWAVMCEPA